MIIKRIVGRRFYTNRSWTMMKNTELAIRIVFSPIWIPLWILGYVLYYLSEVVDKLLYFLDSLVNKFLDKVIPQLKD